MSSVFEGKRIHPDEKWNMAPSKSIHFSSKTFWCNKYGILGSQFERNEYKTSFRIITVWLEVTRLFCTCETIPNKSDNKLDFNVVSADHPINGLSICAFYADFNNSLCKNTLPPSSPFYEVFICCRKYCDKPKSA